MIDPRILGELETHMTCTFGNGFGEDYVILIQRILKMASLDAEAATLAKAARLSVFGQPSTPSQRAAALFVEEVITRPRRPMP